jgi:serine/threonine protein phosphatase 1
MPVICAIGDIHGSLRKLRALMSHCRRKLGGQPATFVFLGDYIDRGTDSAGVVNYLIELQLHSAAPVIALKGNHEAMALEAIDGTAPQEHWLSQGGAATLASYGAMAAGELPSAHVDWLRSLPLRHDDGLRLFVHAGIDPDRPLHRQREFDLLWIREPFLSDRRDHGRLIVHGHTPVAGDAPDLRNNRLNLDTGAVFGGPLTAALFSEAKADPIGFLRAD